MPPASHPPDQRPRVAVLLAGIGMSETDSEEAIRTTPAAISLAVSPYAFHPERLLADARAAGHELLLSLPMEPARYPLERPRQPRAADRQLPRRRTGSGWSGR